MASSHNYALVVDDGPVAEDCNTKIVDESADLIGLDPPRWRTWEFGLYYLVVGATVWTFFARMWAMSQETYPDFEQYRKYLKPGWMFGRLLDASDMQYMGFRQNLGILTAVMAAHVPLSWWVRRTAPTRPNVEFLYSLVFSLVFLAVAHGYHLVKLVAVLLLNFALTRTVGSTRVAPVVTWAWSFGMLLAVAWTGGFRQLNISSGYGGLMRWEITFNFCVLRMISYNMDYYWSLTDSSARLLQNHRTCRGHPDAPTGTLDPPPYCCPKLRAAMPRPRDEYRLIPFLAYMLYIPLYFAGPIVSCNAWMAQRARRPAHLTRSFVAKYGARLVAIIVLMEAMLHTCYTQAITRARAWHAARPADMAVIGYLSLKFIWLKLMVIWRFFRFWSLADGIDPPENMKRCMSNNYSAVAFWRDWHASFNLWNIRYLYVPLGGAKTRWLNLWVIFTFVAVWHDLELNLLAWGWLIVLFMAPELVATAVFRPYARRWWFRHAAALGAVLNIAGMITANLVGFAVGVDGMRHLWEGLFDPPADGALTVLAAAAYLFALAQIMFEIRNEEARREARSVSSLE
ncbi:glycerol transporter [Allomyces javanicus]|nr:glycerol transporter [Allomyces javanicus]